MIRMTLALAATTLALAAPHASAADYDEHFGGKAGMQKIVHDTMVLVLADKRISAFFVETEQDRFQLILAEQLCSLTEGPCKYTGKSMQESHRDHKINTAHFNFLAEHLQVAMERNGVPNAAQNRLVAKLAPMHRDIVKP